MERERERRRNGEREYLLKVTSVENSKAKTHSDFHMNCKKRQKEKQKNEMEHMIYEVIKHKILNLCFF